MSDFGKWRRHQVTTQTLPSGVPPVEFTDEFDAGPVVQYITAPGEMAIMLSGQVLTMGPNGEVYRDAEQLVGVAARKIAQFGISIYAQGKVNPDWWRWTGSGWIKLIAFDANVLK